MTNKKNIKRQRAELLGMPYGTAEKHLRKAIIYELAQQLGKHVCRWCNSTIDSPEDLAIVHVQDWFENPDSFWDLTNVAFSHVSCAAKRGGKRQEEKEMSKIDVYIEDENEKRLPGTKHEGQLYIAGKKNQRYNIRIRNRTRNNLLVVCTVDGRNVITGEPGDWKDSGHVIGGYGEYVFEGWRQSNDTVGAFRFGKAKDSYSSQMGSPENVGVIGIAVFEEHAPDPKIITIREKEYVPFPVPTPRKWIRPWPNPWQDPWQPFWVNDPTVVWTGSSPLYQTGNVISGTSIQFSEGGGTFAASHISLSDTNQGNAVQGENLQSNQQIGTGFGEDIESSVFDVCFRRATEDPVEIHKILYDTMTSLRKQGIKFQRPSQQKKQAEPEAFPQNPGFCAPPRKRI